MRRGRYTTVDNWTFDHEKRCYGSHADFVLLVERCDVREVNGTIWHDGGYRVTLLRGTKPQGFRAKTFIGEMAWADAERYANDWAWKRQA